MAETNGFRLDDRLKNDTIKLAEWPLSDVLLMNDSQYPWVILVPRRQGATEIYQLAEADQFQLLRESTYLGQRLMVLFSGDKLNIAALGNVVSQLHIHHVVRFEGDIAWPAPVWGKHPVTPYSEEALKKQLEVLAEIQQKKWC
ncbi:HIT domain-containing protein [Alkalimarinus coralli]|uniref:HIT domain-containing protein n=1 Tax=Alkalimarinus coralli TaxID=2935863 RepID=UPI00202AD4D9|nr:HIT domain-containing protein [Alkalimarinus coralli]